MYVAKRDIAFLAGEALDGVPVTIIQELGYEVTRGGLQLAGDERPVDERTPPQMWTRRPLY